MAAADMKKVSDFRMDAEEFVELLGDLLEHNDKLQNNPPHFVPQEDYAADVVVKKLSPLTEENGGVLSVRKVTYKPGRSNVIIKYPGQDDSKVVSFVGSHLDMVPAQPEEWDYDPFKITREGDVLYARGVTDCMGHVAMLTLLMQALGKQRPALKRSVICVFIANEEASLEPGIGVDELERQGELKVLKNGPLYWVDSADVGPTLGTGGMTAWEISGTGKLFHSGLPHRAINAAELVWETTREVQRRFHEKYKRHELADKYKFNVSSSMKPTQMSTPPGGLNQIPGKASVRGDIRLTPFYTIPDVKKDVEAWVAEINANVDKLPTIGFSRYSLPDEGLKGDVSVKWLGEAFDPVAVDLDSPGYHAILDATTEVFGESKAFSLTGSLPIIGGLRKSGYDVQICGYGDMGTYHAKNERLSISQMCKGFQTLCTVIEKLE